MKFKAAFDKLKKKDKILILVLAGILLVVIALPVSKDEKKDTVQTTTQSANVSSGNDFSYQDYLENKLTKSLSKVDGVGKVQVIITLKGTGEKVLISEDTYSENIIHESDSDGGVRDSSEKSQSQSYLYSDSTTGSAPYVSKEIAPQVEGVVIIAQGGGDAIVVTNVTKAVEALLNVPVHKIQVLKMTD